MCSYRCWQRRADLKVFVYRIEVWSDEGRKEQLVKIIDASTVPDESLKINMDYVKTLTPKDFKTRYEEFNPKSGWFEMVSSTSFNQNNTPIPCYTKLNGRVIKNIYSDHFNFTYDYGISMELLTEGCAVPKIYDLLDFYDFENNKYSVPVIEFNTDQDGLVHFAIGMSKGTLEILNQKGVSKIGWPCDHSKEYKGM